MTKSDKDKNDEKKKNDEYLEFSESERRRLEVIIKLETAKKEAEKKKNQK